MGERPTGAWHEAPDYRHLPPPIRLEDTRAFQDVVVPQDEGDDEYRQLAWLVRTIGF